MKLIGAGSGHVVHLSGAVTALVHRVGKGVHRHLRDGIQTKNEVRGKPAIQIGERIVGLQAVYNVAI